MTEKIFTHWKTTLFASLLAAGQAAYDLVVSGTVSPRVLVVAAAIAAFGVWANDPTPTNKRP